MMKIYMEWSNGFKFDNDIHVHGLAHSFEDVTNKPCHTIDTNIRTVLLIFDGQNIMSGNKPKYNVMPMVEINAMQKNGFKVASTFSGGGGSSTGYKMAGFDVVYANEFVDAARDTYRANHPTTKLDGRDIRTVTAASILEMTGMKVGELDLFDGSPPCSAFSTAGKREKSWGKAKSYSDNKHQVVDDLFFEYSRLLRGLQPKTFVAENVSGLVKGTAKGYFLRILAELKSCGYQVSAKLLNAAYLGVPQSRERLIFVGVRNDLYMAPVFPKPMPYCYTLRDACPWITHQSGNKNFVQYRRDSSSAANTITATISEKNASIIAIEKDAWMTGYATGKEWHKIPVGGQSEKYFQLTRQHPDKPVGTITVEAGKKSAASVAHPYECRKFSIAELKRICSFPDDYILTGIFAQQWERCGRSVPPVMMMHISAAVRDQILRKL